MSEWWDQGWGGDMPIGTPETVRQVLERAGSLFKMRDDLGLGEKLQIFFMDALIPYFDCLWEGMDQTSGHIIYRLSDRIPHKIRRNIEVYPRAVRREQMFRVETDATKDGWTTLEEWRREWETHNTNIPPLQELLPEGVTLQLGIGKPETEMGPAQNVIDVSPEPDREEQLAQVGVKLLKEKERAMYWVCRLVTTCHDELTQSCAISYLREVDYDENRIQRMIKLGEPAK